MDLATAYVQIVPSAKGIKGSITKELGGECQSAGAASGESFGASMVSKIKGVIAAAGLGAALKATIDAGADLQQSFGGLDTIYEDASEAAKQYAKEAAKVGISANDYAEQAVSFGASLKMAFGGDTQKAVEAANTAIMDMTDNAAKMGTPIESIQTAYQGFAKQNYTMLDNLKLGYGGTKQEMERLLKDAQKISGVKYDMNNLGDVYDAIHVIQGELHLTGVAAEEAEGTFSGSMGAMKASLTNVMAAMATGENLYEPLQALFDNIRAFVFKNLVPMMKDIIGSIPQLLANLISEAGTTLSEMASHADEFVDFGVQLVFRLIDGMTQTSGDLLKGIWDLCKALFDAIVNYDWAGAMSEFMNSMAGSLSEAAYSMFGDYDAGIIDSLLSGITSNLPRLLEQAVSFITTIVNGITKALPSLISMAGDLIVKFAGAILDNLPTILESGMTLLMNLVQGITDNLPAIATSAVEVIGKLLVTIAEHLPEIIEMGFKLLGQLASGIIKALPKIGEAIITVWKKIFEIWRNIDWLELGKNVILGIAKGVENYKSQLWQAIKDVCKGALKSAKDFFGISSPSKVMRDQVGKWLPEGMAVGIEDNIGVVSDAMQDLTEEATGSINGSVRSVVAVQGANTNNLNRASMNGTVATDTNGINAIIEALSHVTVTMDGKAVGNLVASPVNYALGRLSVRRV